VIADSPTYGRVLFLEGELQSAETDQVIYHELLVHPVMAATASIPERNVLVVGGGEGATVQEVLRWTNVSNVTWIDIDEGLVNLCRRHLDWTENDVYNNPKVTFLAEDIRTALPRIGQHYNVIILDLPDPDPSETTSDRLYGPSFWTLLHNHLREGGAIVSHAGPISPGADVEKYRNGIHLIQSIEGVGYPYHILIPSFQGEWGFWMSVPPVCKGPFPAECSIIDEEVMNHAFTWSRMWNSSAIGTIRPL
jgi:spermidine synthase